jgi:hypothetical protein
MDIPRDTHGLDRGLYGAAIFDVLSGWKSPGQSHFEETWPVPRLLVAELMLCYAAGKSARLRLLVVFGGVSSAHVLLVGERCQITDPRPPECMHSSRRYADARCNPHQTPLGLLVSWINICLTLIVLG